MIALNPLFGLGGIYKNIMVKKNTKENNSVRSPVIAVMGHVDHGKSTLLDYIRKTNVAENEAGGITQCLSSYEISHKTKETGKEKRITFLDTPGHEAFTSLRERGARIADIVVLVVSAEDGVMPQTKEVITNLFATETPFVVAINKIDTNKADVQKTIRTLAENEVYLEDMHGDIPSVSISAKTGEGVPELLDMILLVADMEELKGDPDQGAEGFVLESTMCPRTGTASILIIKNGTLKVGDLVVAENAYTPVRQIQTYDGNLVKEISFSSPVSVSGWNIPPTAGAEFYTVSTKKEAEQEIKDFSASFKESLKENPTMPSSGDIRNIPIVLKADNVGSIEAIKKEIQKLNEKNQDTILSFIIAEVGSISETDVQNASINSETLLLGFNTSISGPAKKISDNLKMKIKLFSVIYKMTEWIEEYIDKTRQLKDIDKEHGSLKILKCFSLSKKGCVLGGVVKSGLLSKDDHVKVIRNEEIIGQGKIKDLQEQKVSTKSISEGKECGILLESSIEIKEGDLISAFTTVRE